MVRSFKEYENIDKKCDEVIFEHEAEGLQEAEYQGKKVKLNDPIRGGSKKFKQMYGEMVNEKGPCWSGYKQVGMKTKNGKQVPNCVPE